MQSRTLTAILVVLDALLFTTIWFGTYYFRDWLNDTGRWHIPINPLGNYKAALWVYLPFWLCVTWYYGLYNHRGKTTGLNELRKILRAFLVGLIGSLAIAYLFKQWDIGRFILLMTPPLYLVWLYASRSILREWKQSQLRRGIGVINVAIVGVGRTARRVHSRIVNHPEGGYRVLGFIDPHPRRRTTRINDVPVLGNIRNMNEVLHDMEVDEVFMAVPKMPQDQMMNLIVTCEQLGVHFKIVSNLFQVITSQVQIDVIDEVPVIPLGNAHLPKFQAAMKRLLDILVALPLLLILGIPMLIIAILVKLDSPGPVLFRQNRVGLNGMLFEMLKFRTMRTESDPYAVAPTDPGDRRITGLGRTLRKYSLDEFPQLWNVLRGDMSMVGPRPEMPFIVDKYEPWQRRRLDVKPGVTGLWQIVGRKNLPLSLNIEYDFYYIKNQSLFLDILILLKTIPAVIFGKGAF